MTGGVRKRGKTWSYYFDLGKINGKRQKKEKGGFPTKRAAEAALAAAITEYNTAGQVFEPTEITVSDYLDQWYDLYCKVNLKYNTQVGYLHIINTHLKPRFGAYKLRALTPAVLQEYANALKIQGYSKSHVTGILTTFQAALNYAVEPLHYIVQNPMKSVRSPRVERKPRERIVLTAEQWNSILERFKGSRYEIMLLIGYYTGLRISEVCALTWDDIDLEHKTLTVNKQTQRRNFADARDEVKKKITKERRTRWYFNSPKTETSNRTVPFGDTLCKALRRVKAQQLQDEMKYGEYYTIHVLVPETDEKGNQIYQLVPVQKSVASSLPRARLVCISETGYFTSSDSFKYCARIIHHELGIPFDFHSLRHTHATKLIEAGANVKNVQARLGHTKISTTLQTYAHDTPYMGIESVEIFERVANCDATHLPPPETKTSANE